MEWEINPSFTKVLFCVFRAAGRPLVALATPRNHRKNHNQKIEYLYSCFGLVVGLFLQYKKQSYMKETLLYGCKIGEPNYMEEILYQCKGYTNKDELMNKGKEWAAKNGYDRLRISVVDLSMPPDFSKTINV